MRKYKLLITIVSLFFTILSIPHISKAESNDTALKSISIEPSGYELVQDESDNKIYRVKVDNSVTSIKVNAVSNNKDATISVNGNNELAVGTNKVTVNVTAKNGEKSVYTIYVRRASAPIAQEQVIPNVQDEYNEKQQENTQENMVKGEEEKVDENNANKNENRDNNANKNENRDNNTSNKSEVNSINNNSENKTHSDIKNFFNNKNIIIGIILIIIIMGLIITKKKNRGKHS